MRVHAAVLGVALALMPRLAVADEPPRLVRGPVTVVALWLFGAGAGALGFGLAELLNAGNTRAQLDVYLTAGAPASADAETVASLAERLDGHQRLAAVGLGVAGALVLAGALCLVLDAPRPVAVGVWLTGDGGQLTLSGRW
jgi:hypothetical protein